MATSPVVLLDAADAVGFGPIVNMGATPFRALFWTVEPSDDATANEVGGVTQGVMIQYSFDAAFPQPPEGHTTNWATGLITYLPITIDNPEGAVAPQAVANYINTDVQSLYHGQKVVYPYLRAKLLVPLVTGTITVKFYFE